MRASYQGNAAWSTPVNLPVMANGYEFAKYFNEGCINAGQTPQYSESQLAILEQYVQNPAGINCWPVIEDNYSMTTLYENNSRGVGSTDWFKFHYKEFAFKQNHNLSLNDLIKELKHRGYEFVGVDEFLHRQIGNYVVHLYN
jgi:hypothetical protein